MLLRVFFFLLTGLDPSNVNSFIHKKSVSHENCLKFLTSGVLVVFGAYGLMHVSLPFKLLLCKTVI